MYVECSIKLIMTELKYQHDVEIANWEGLMQASQDLLRSHVCKHKEQVLTQCFLLIPLEIPKK